MLGRCVLFVVCSMSFVLCCSLVVVRNLLFVGYSLLFDVCRLLVEV